MWIIGAGVGSKEGLDYGDRHDGEECTWDLIENAIRTLDGSLCPVELYGPRDQLQRMIIEGGNEGRYLVCIQEIAQKYSLINSNIPSETKKLLVRAGLDSDYEPLEYNVQPELVQSLDTVLAVAKTYAETGQPDSRFQWLKSPLIPLEPDQPVYQIDCRVCQNTFETNNPRVTRCHHCYLLMREQARKVQ